MATTKTDDSGLKPVSRQAQLLTLALVVLALAALFWPRSEKEQAPGGFLIDANGRPVTLGSRMAPVTLVHFWATWCPPCMTEIPSLNRLIDEFGEYKGDFTVLMIAVDDDSERIEDFAGERSRSMLYDPQWEVAHRYGTRKLPETYLVVQGQVEERYIGAQDWDAPGIREDILEAIESLGGPEQAAGP
jgi:thiol-disulfide isomerase/thioredoxin